MNDITLKAKPIQYDYEPSPDGRSVMIIEISNKHRQPYSLEALEHMVRPGMPAYLQEMAQGALDSLKSPQSQQEVSTITMAEIEGYKVYFIPGRNKWFVKIKEERIYRTQLSNLEKEIKNRIANK